MQKIEEEPLDENIPWIDLIAAGVSLYGEGKVAWIVVSCSHEQLLNLAISRRCRPQSGSWKRLYSERATKVLGTLTSINDRLSSSCTQDDLAVDIQIAGFSRDPADRMVLLTWHTDTAKTAPQSPNSSTKHFENFDELCATVFGPIRYYFGPGWFPSIRTFSKMIEPMSNTAPGAVGRVTLKNHPSRSSLLANIGTGRMIEFGWRPPNWKLLHCRLAPNANIDKHSVRQLRHLDSQGIRFFQLPSLSLLRETYLAFNDSDFLKESRQRFFCTNHAIDKGLLAIEYSKHGIRGNPMTSNEEATAQTKIFLYRFPAGVIGLLRGLLHKLDNLVIAYTPTATTTTRSAVLDRLIRLYQVNPDDEDLETSIKQEIRSLLYSSLARPPLRTARGPLSKGSTYQNTIHELDQQIEELAGVGFNPYSLPTIRRRSKGLGLLSLIINQAERDNPSLEDGRRAAFVTGAKVLPIGKVQKDKLAGAGNTKKPEESAEKVYRDVRRSLNSNQDQINKLEISASSRFRPLTVYNSFAMFMRRVAQDILFVPERLHGWIAQRFRLVWLAPLDPIDTYEAIYRASHSDASCEGRNRSAHVIDDAHMRVVIGSKHSSDVYPKLFSSAVTQNSIEVNLYSFFDFCDELSPNSDSTHSSWLRNKIIETRRLHKELESHFDYCSDFELIALLEEGSSQEKATRCLDLLSTESILKAILLHDGGEATLYDWCQDLMTKCKAYLYANRETSDPPEHVDRSRLEIFMDTLGIAAAAIDCCRLSFLNPSPNKSPFVVYLLPHRINDHFLRRQQHSSTDVKEYDDNRLNPDHNSQPDTIGLELAMYFAESPFNIQEAVTLLLRWYLKDGWRHEETAEAFLLDLKDELGQVDGAYNGYKAHRDNLLKAFHERLESMR